MKNLSLLGIALLLVTIISCSKDKVQQTNETPENKLISYTDCKNLDPGSVKGTSSNDTSCIEYSYDQKTRELNIKHINAGFNCCPGILNCNFDITNDTITIEEFEQTAGCFCECLYDLVMVLYVEQPKSYWVIFEEPYCGSQQKLEFQIDLNTNPTGYYCVPINIYPWGI